MKLLISNKNVLVTGASSGLGRSFALEYAKYGAKKICLAARRQDKLDEVRRECLNINKDSNVITVCMDVSNVESIRKGFDEIETKWNGEVANVVVNNAGVSKTNSFLNTTEEDFNFQIDTNLKGMWHISQEGAKRMIKRKVTDGSIINVASILGLRVSTNLSAYAVSKAGVVQMTKASALELLRHNIRVNCICPGYVKTEMNKDFFDSEAGKLFVEKRIVSRRLGQPEELSGALMLLSSDASSFMSGAVIAVDLGHLTSPL